MAEPEASRDLIDEGVEVSQTRLRNWPAWAQHLYALLVTAGWLVAVTASVITVVMLAVGEPAQPVLVVLVLWIGIVAVVVMSWLLWHMAVPLYANLATQGQFDAWRRDTLRRFDTWFTRITLVVLLSIMLIPILQLFE